jgi:hypothetical protein
MDPKIVTAIIVVIAVVAVIAVLFITRRRKTEHLKQKFGSEYDRVVHQHGDPQRAETVLEQREKRVSRFEIRTLPPAERDRYTQLWAFVQKKFVDDPKAAVNEADRLVTDVMKARGYPMGEFNQRADDISVNYPNAVANYRAAHEIVTRHGKGQASTEDLRKAMVHFRSLIDELLGKPGVAHKEVA